MNAKMVAANRASKRRRTSSETQKFHGEHKGGDKEEHQEEEKTVADGCSSPFTIGLSNDVKRNKPPVIVFAHGAGAPSSSDWLMRWKKMLLKSLNAIEVVTFDYPCELITTQCLTFFSFFSVFLVFSFPLQKKKLRSWEVWTFVLLIRGLADFAGGKKKAPPKAEKLVEFHANIVRKKMVKYAEHPLILVGKSMGSRVSCMVAGAKGVNILAVVCLGYPLKGMNGAVRDETLLQLRVPVMFVQGSKDVLCPLEKLDAVRKKMSAVSELHVIEGGDHSFKVAKKHLQLSETTQDESEDRAIQAIATFVSSL